MAEQLISRRNGIGKIVRRSVGFQDDSVSAGFSKLGCLVKVGGTVQIQKIRLDRSEPYSLGSNQSVDLWCTPIQSSRCCFEILTSRYGRNIAIRLIQMNYPLCQKNSR